MQDFENANKIEDYTPPPHYKQTFIGVLTQPMLDEISKYFGGKNYSHTGESYHKYVESSGATSVVIPHDMPFDIMKEILDQLHGICLPGGGGEVWFCDRNTKKINEYGEKILQIYDYVISENKNKRPFFLFGICLGLQEIVFAATKDVDCITRPYGNHYKPNSMDFFESDSLQKSRFFSKDKTKIDEYIKVYTGKNTYYEQNEGITPENFTKYKELTDNFNLIATNITPKGIKTVTIIEHKLYPIFATQWHPEKGQWERRSDYFQNLSRDSSKLNADTSLIQNMIAYMRSMKQYSVSDFEAQSTILKNYLAYNFIPYPIGSYYEKIFIVNDISLCKNVNECAETIFNAKAQDEIYECYKRSRDGS